MNRVAQIGYRVIAGLLAASALETIGAEGWPQYRGPTANGSTPEKIQTAWPSGGPRQIWRTPTPAGFSTFAVAKGRAFTLILRDVEGVPTEVCIALDGESGKELWATPLGFAKYDGGGDSGAPGNNGGDGPVQRRRATATGYSSFLRL